MPNFAKIGESKTELYNILKYKCPAGAFMLRDFYKAFSVYAECFP